MSSAQARGLSPRKRGTRGPSTKTCRVGIPVLRSSDLWIPACAGMTNSLSPLPDGRSQRDTFGAGPRPVPAQAGNAGVQCQDMHTTPLLWHLGLGSSNFPPGLHHSRRISTVAPSARQRRHCRHRTSTTTGSRGLEKFESRRPRRPSRRAFREGRCVLQAKCRYGTKTQVVGAGVTRHCDLCFQWKGGSYG